MALSDKLTDLASRIKELEPLVDALLAAPAVHRLIADAEFAGDVADTSACRDQIKNPLAKLPRVAPSSHAVLLIGQQHAIPVIRLHQTQGALSYSLVLSAVAILHCSNRSHQSRRQITTAPGTAAAP